jgi:hypothetical protein
MAARQHDHASSAHPNIVMTVVLVGRKILFVRFMAAAGTSRDLPCYITGDWVARQ